MKCRSRFAKLKDSSLAGETDLGFEKLRQAGSHVIMRRGSKGCVVPLHNEVKVGTLADVLRQADGSPDEFIAAL
ncbi:MAG: type II toxin-antitoxin system HicA family toxin [Sterolibacterium sp.]